MNVIAKKTKHHYKHACCHSILVSMYETKQQGKHPQDNTADAYTHMHSVTTSVFYCPAATNSRADCEVSKCF